MPCPPKTLPAVRVRGQAERSLFERPAAVVLPHLRALVQLAQSRCPPLAGDGMVPPVGSGGIFGTPTDSAERAQQEEDAAPD